MHRAPHERLRELRADRGYKGQKHFVSHANRYGYRITVRRYGDIERGDVLPNIQEVILICKAMEISADSWLLGRQPRVDTGWLTEPELKIVRDVIAGLLSLR